MGREEKEGEGGHMKGNGKERKGGKANIGKGY